MSPQDRFGIPKEFSKLHGTSASEEPNKLDVPKPMFDIPGWRGAYAKALLETDPAKLEFLIREAEFAILGRFLEERTCSLQTEEILDLQNAVEVLSQLRIANPVVQRYV